LHDAWQFHSQISPIRVPQQQEAILNMKSLTISYATKQNEKNLTDKRKETTQNWQLVLVNHSQNLITNNTDKS
jgi:hypothetical protein